MPHLDYFVAAESVSIDQVTNRVSIFNILEELRSKQFPATISSVVAIACFWAEPEEIDRDYQGTIRLSGSSLDAPIEFPMNFRFASRRQRLTHRIDGIRCERPGSLVFEFALNGHGLAEHVMPVVAAE